MIKLTGLICLLICLAWNHFAAAATVRITEFLTENDGGIRDSDGDTPDWIELQNGTAAPVNLAGWRLTDNPTNLTKWTFPATNIPAGGFLIVFASGKNRATNGAQLHTNFQLDNDGGYLALVDPNGAVVSEFNYPQQRRNVSFGPASLSPAATNLLSVNARWYVPVNGGLGSSWIVPGFDASTWRASWW